MEADTGHRVFHLVFMLISDSLLAQKTLMGHLHYYLLRGSILGISNTNYVSLRGHLLQA